MGSKADMKVLGIVFDSWLEWSAQGEKLTATGRQATQALSLVRKYFICKEMSKLITALVYSRFYYAAQVWLLPNLKKRLMDRLYSVRKKFKSNQQTFNLQTTSLQL